MGIIVVCGICHHITPLVADAAVMTMLLTITTTLSMMMLFLQQGGYAQQQFNQPAKITSCKSDFFREGPGAISSGKWGRKGSPIAFLKKPFVLNKKVRGVLNSCYGISTFRNTVVGSTTILGKRYDDGTNELAGIKLHTLACKKLAKRKPQGIVYYTVLDETFPLVSNEVFAERLRRFVPESSDFSGNTAPTGGNRIIRVAWSGRFAKKIKKRSRSKRGFGKGGLRFYCFVDGEGTFPTLEDAKAATARERRSFGLKGKVNFNSLPSKGGCNGGPWYVMDYIPNPAAEIRTPYDMCATQVTAA